MAYKQITTLYWLDVERLCLRHGWYTTGSDADYEKLQQAIRNLPESEGQFWADRIQAVAEDIKLHSDNDYEIEEIMNALSRAATRRFAKL